MRIISLFLRILYHEITKLATPQKIFAVPVVDNALVPCYARLVHKSQRGLEDIKKVVKGSILRDILNKDKKERYIYKGI